ncbi:aminoacyl-tRNA hydrolase [Magnetofaba australis]|nr:aminoacyl-tRNA hydrolase [Magnetofaba australis]
MAVLLVGLGNPGAQYANTRHNLGWDAVQAMARDHHLSGPSQRFKGLFGDGSISGERVYWLLPETYMNLSGESVGEAARFYKIEPEQVIVFHDDMDLPLGKVKMKVGGGNGGHNGLKSIQQHLGTADFTRIRLGIGRPPERWDPKRFVLAPFTSDERKISEPLLEALSFDALPPLLAGDLPGAMNRLSLKLNPKPERGESKKEKREKRLAAEKAAQESADGAS